MSLQALLIRMNTTREWSRLDLQWLKRQRRMLGSTVFADVVVAHAAQNVSVSRPSSERRSTIGEAQLVGVLDQVNEPEDEDGERS